MHRRSIRYLLAVSSIALAAAATPAAAKSHHHHQGHHAGRAGVHRTVSGHSGRHQARRHRRAVARRYGHRLGAAAPAEATPASTGLFGGDAGIVAEARRWVGTNPTGRSSLWCARFMNFVLGRSGYQGTGSDLARSFVSYGRRIAGPQVGAIAVMSRRGGGHVGVVSGLDGNGNPIIISGNHGHRVAESVYPRGRIYAYVMPGA